MSKTPTDRLYPEDEVREILLRILLEMNTPVDPSGMSLAQLEGVLRGRTAFLYGHYQGVREMQRAEDRRHGRA